MPQNLREQPCLDNDAVLAFVEGKLTSAELAEEHMAECPSCRMAVSEAAKYYFENDPAAGAVSGEASLADWGQETLVARPARPGSPQKKGIGLRSGESVGRYVIESTAGVGGMGVVYVAQDPQLGRTVALKLMRSDERPDHQAGANERLLREARAMAKVAHPNVVAVYDAGMVGGEVFVAMELVDGSTLTPWLKTRPRTTAEILDVFIQAGRGLSAAHSAGLVHRDFKPDNMLIGADGRVRVTDFGLARQTVLSADDQAHFTPIFPAGTADRADNLTRTGMLIGTPAYMAPEQFLGNPADARTDQFNYCVALYEALYGQRPFGAADVASLSIEVTNGRVRDAPDDSSVSRPLRDLLLRGLKVRPEARYASMERLLELLAAFSPNREAAPAIPRRRRSLLLLGGAAACLMAGVVEIARGRHPSLSSGPAAVRSASAPTPPRSVSAPPSPPLPIRLEAAEPPVPQVEHATRSEKSARPATVRHKPKALVAKVPHRATSPTKRPDRETAPLNAALKPLDE